MAFRIAGRQGTREALKAAGPVLLQPVFRIAIHAPAIFTGGLGPIVSSHAGQVLGFDADPDAKGWEIFEALVPGSALGGIANDVRASTQGVGWFEARLRPLRGAARQGRRPHRPGAREGARLARQEVRDDEREAGRVEGHPALAEDGDLDPAGRGAAVVHDQTKVGIDDEVVVKARQAKIAGELGVHVDRAGGGREHFHDDRVVTGARVPR